MGKRPHRAKRAVTQAVARTSPAADYERLVADVSELLEEARFWVARSANAVLSATYWQIGRRIVEHEQGGKARAGYGRELLIRLGEDLTKQYGRGFSWRSLYQMRSFYQWWDILQTPSAKSEVRAICPHHGMP